MPDPLALRAAGLALRTERGPLRPLWRAAYGVTGRIAGAVVAGRSGSAYVARSVAARDAAYGLSDIDLAVVAHDTAAARRRRDRLRRLPLLARAMPDLAVYSKGELSAACAASTLEHDGAALYLAGRIPRDDLGLRERPGVGGPTSDWRRLFGREARPARSAFVRQTAAWLELQFWWARALRFATEPDHRHATYLCFKLIAEPVRILLALEHGEVIRDREHALRRAIDLLPEEEPALRRALALRADLTGPADWHAGLGALARLSQRIAGLLDTPDRTEVRLAGAEPLLLDWRGLVLPGGRDHRLAPAQGDPGKRSDLAAGVAGAGSHGYSPLRSGDLLVLAAGEPWTRSFLRGAHCPATAPVAFALIHGAATAAFPDLPGLRARDVARRAVAEHRAWLATGGSTLEHRTWLDGRDERLGPEEREASKLLTAARAGLFQESLDRGEPRLPVGRDEVAAALGTEVGKENLAELRRAVRSLPPYGARVETSV